MGDIGPTQQRYEVLPPEPVASEAIVDPVVGLTAEPVVTSVVEQMVEQVAEREPGRVRA